MTMHARPHHLLCLLSSTVKGYSPVYMSTFLDLQKRFNGGETLVVTNAADNLCEACPFDSEGGLCISPNNQVSPDTMDTRVLETLGLQYGDSLTRDELVGKIKQLPVGRFTAMCEGCTWKDGTGCLHTLLSAIQTETSG